MSLLDSQRCIILAVEEHYDEYGCDPKFRYLAAECGIAVSTVNYHIDILVRRGLLKIAPNATGGRVISRPSPEVLSMIQDGADE